MKKLITICLLLAILAVGCSQGAQNYNTAPPTSPATGGGCGVAPQNQEAPEVKYVGIQNSL